MYRILTRENGLILLDNKKTILEKGRFVENSHASVDRQVLIFLSQQGQTFPKLIPQNYRGLSVHHTTKKRKVGSQLDQRSSVPLAQRQVISKLKAAGRRYSGKQYFNFRSYHHQSWATHRRTAEKKEASELRHPADICQSLHALRREDNCTWVTRVIIYPSNLKRE